MWAVLRLVPRRTSVLTAMGRQSLAVYLLHGLLINAATAWGLWASLQQLPPAWRLGIAITGGTALACLLTGAAPLIRPLLDFGWLLSPAADNRECHPPRRRTLGHADTVRTSRQCSGLTRWMFG